MYVLYKKPVTIKLYFAICIIKNTVLYLKGRGSEYINQCIKYPTDNNVIKYNI